MKKILISQLLFFVCYFSCKTDNATKLYSNNNCDTSNVSFSNHVKPILSSNCNSCHIGGGNSGSVKLDTYDDVKDAINNKNLKKSITYQNTSSKNMPPGAKMSNCNVSIIEAWINQGMKNN